jgi:hypothetical protein
MELRLCEVIVGHTAVSARSARALARRLVRRTDADFASAMAVTGGRNSSVLGALGFAPVPRVGPIMTVRAVGRGPDGAQLSRPASWHTAIGDLELF